MEYVQNRMERYKYLVQNGWLTHNEARRLCGLPELEEDLELMTLGCTVLPSPEAAYTIPKIGGHDHAGT